MAKEILKPVPKEITGQSPEKVQTFESQAPGKDNISCHPIEGLEAVARESGLIEEEQTGTPTTSEGDSEGKKILEILQSLDND